MATEIKVPVLGESVKEATVGKWFKQPGDAVAADEPIVELETDKVTVEVPAPAAGVLGQVRVEAGTTVEVGAILGSITEGAAGGKPAAKASAPALAAAPAAAKPSAPASASAPAAPPALAAAAPPPAASPGRTGGIVLPSPSARKLMTEAGLSAASVAGSGRRGQVLKSDVQSAIAGGAAAVVPVPQATAAPAATVPQLKSATPPEDAAREERVRMTRLRQTIARRLKDAQNTAAMLTTFNEVDMSGVMALRAQYKEQFEKRHGVKLGFMGFFVKACIQALKEIPAVNGEIDGTDIVYKNYYHVGVAVGTERGLVVPVLRNADAMTLAQIESSIGDFGKRARDGKLAIEEMQGGTFTISNGGVYGSLLSTPILNAPQSGILGMHRIQERPVVQAGQVVIKPMMYLALSYDHRLVDGREAVTFLVRVKEGLEDPQRLILEL